MSENSVVQGRTEVRDKIALLLFGIANEPEYKALSGMAAARLAADCILALPGVAPQEAQVERIFREGWVEGYARGLSAGQDYSHSEVRRQAEFYAQDWADSAALASHSRAAPQEPQGGSGTVDVAESIRGLAFSFDARSRRAAWCHEAADEIVRLRATLSGTTPTIHQQ